MARAYGDEKCEHGFKRGCPKCVVPPRPTLRAQYLKFYKAADDILKQPDNPCDIKFIGGQATCTVSRVSNGKRYGFPHGTMCCTGCEHHDPEVGCTTKSLWCKLGWCYGDADSIVGMKVIDHPMFIALSKLREQAQRANIPMYMRSSLEQNLNKQKGGRNKLLGASQSLRAGSVGKTA